MSAAARRLLYRALGIVFGAAALPLTFNEHGLSSGHPPWLTLSLLLVCLAGVAASLIAVYRIDHPRGDELGRLTREALRRGSVSGAVHHSPGSLWQLAGGGALMAALAALAWRPGSHSTSVFFGLCAALFAGGAILLRRANRTPRELRIDAAGIHSPDYGLIAWEDVVGLRRHYLEAFGAQSEALQVCLRDPGRYIARLPAWQQRHHELEAASLRRYAPVLIPLDSHRIPADLAYATAVSLRRRAVPPFVNDWEPRMDDAEIAEYLEARSPLAALTHADGADDVLPAPDFAVRLQQHAQAVALAAASQRRQQVRQRERQRRWHEGAWRRGLIAATVAAAYALARAYFEGLLG
ncbi:hypothetical protein K4L06_03415 [Lysobacter sp. BMK333-48F3]|uniref:hypothetical protein n=1 Tax=Lysobacter sp. BMK333-48F3 TaxID=2867962 RepID=UPI001C8B2BED|nr:hypothetical protein [Lysobacter sp. BMK333-48F3]MBX9400345.1 hypothetical protein [Lysobacter sp. BMK333-48F3]